MKNFFWIAAFLPVFVWTTESRAVIFRQIKTVGLETGYVPKGFDELNNAQVTVEGTFRDKCYKVGPHDFTLKGNIISITQGAYFFGQGCAMVLVPFSQTISLGMLPVGNYKVVDSVSGQTLGALPIKKAQPKPPLAYPDDYLYAPVSDASIVNSGGTTQIRIAGRFTDDCTQFKEIRVQVYNKVIEVLPITERTGHGCNRGYRPFQVSKQTSIVPGHYLLHVRSLSGDAINKMTDVY